MSPLAIRPATVADAEAAARVLTASITQLCDADHHGDPAAIAHWVANKTPEAVAAMIAAGGMMVAERDGQVVGVGAIDPAQGWITLNYVAPEVRGTGVSTALLGAMEAALAAAGTVTARVKSTMTARDFYVARGWRATGPGQAGRWIDAVPMEKRLRP